MAATSYDWSRFLVRINVSSSGKSLYDAWSTRAGMEYWFLRLSEYKKSNGILLEPKQKVQKGDTYKWLWHGWPDDTVEHGTILDCNDIDYIKFSFGKAGNCAVRIKKEERETMVELEQDEIPTDERGRHYWHLGCKTGWTFYLANLKSLFEGGIDLRNKNEQLKNVINS
jgi:hypothetical protein